MSEGDKNTLDSADILRIMELLPHRYPFLMVDRIVDMDGDNSAVGIKNVTANEPHFMGHFPGQPVMPGVLLIEGMAQTAGALCVHSRGQSGAPKLVYFMTIDKVKFRKPVRPGSVLKLHIEKVSAKGPLWKFKGFATVDDVRTSEAEFGAMIVDPQR